MIGRIFIILKKVILIIIIYYIAKWTFNAFYKPDHLKPLISQQIEKSIGRKIVFHGKVFWKIFPHFGLQAEQVEIGNAEGFGDTPFATIDKAQLSIEALPFLRGKVKTDDLIIDGATVHFIKDKNGKMNWADLMHPKAKPTVDAAEAEAASEKSAEALQIDIPKAEIQHVTVTWDDEQTNQHGKITELSFTGNDIRDKAWFPLKLSFQIQDGVPPIQGKIALEGNIKMNLEKKSYDIKKAVATTNFAGGNLPNQKVRATLKANFFGTDNSLQTDSLRIELDGTVVTGSFAIKDFSKKIANFNLYANYFDADSWIVDDQASKKSQAGQAPKSAKVADNGVNEFIKSLILKGKIRVKQLTAMRLKMRGFQTSVNMKNGIANISPIKMQLYRGFFSGKVVANLQQRHVPVIRIDGKLQNIDMRDLLHDLASYDKFSGVTNLKLNVQTKGTSSENLTKNLNGKMQFDLRNGTLKGIDVAYLLRSARAVIKKQLPPKQEGANQTNFGDLTGTAEIRNGVILNNDLRIISSNATVTGEGVISLPKKTIAYKLKATPAEEEDDLALVEILIKVTGNLFDPSVRLDTAALLKNIVKHQLKREVIQKKLEGVIQEGIEKLKWF